jgi:hypothetical protein
MKKNFNFLFSIKYQKAKNKKHINTFIHSIVNKAKYFVQQMSILYSNLKMLLNLPNFFSYTNFNIKYNIDYICIKI